MAGAKQGARDGIAGRGNEPTGMDSGESERPIVLMKPGNRARRDPVEGRGCRESGTEWGKDVGDIEPLRHLNATRSDSRPRAHVVRSESVVPRSRMR